MVYRSHRFIQRSHLLLRSDTINHNLPLQIRFLAGIKDTSQDETENASSSSSAMEWRKLQLDRLEKKFNQPSMIVQKDEDLQPMWKEMESRVTRRKPRTIEEMGGRTGRVNVKKTDEEMWLQEGLYEDETSNKSTK